MAPKRIINGVAISPGLALGTVLVVRATADKVPTWSIAPEEVEHEVERLRQALEAASDEMQRRQRLVADQTGEKDAQIFAVHRMILQDPAALAQVETNLRTQRINAEGAVQQLIQRLENTLGSMEGNSVRSYAADLADPWHAVLEALMQSGRQEAVSGGVDFVLAAAELTPKVVTYLERAPSGSPASSACRACCRGWRRAWRSSSTARAATCSCGPTPRTCASSRATA